MNIFRRCAGLFAVLFAVLSSPVSNAANLTEDFYWSGTSRGRGVGTVANLDCQGKVLDAGLCYDACRDGFSGVGPICWNTQKASIPRGAGTWAYSHIDSQARISTYCHGDDELQGLLCYTPCDNGYHGVGPVCWLNPPTPPLSYGRGAGTPARLSCNSNKEFDSGLCYVPCSAGFRGVGPVCWGEAPRGYIACGLGFAKDTTTCGMVIGNQVMAVGKLSLDAYGAYAASEAIKLENLVEKYGYDAVMADKLEKKAANQGTAAAAFFGAIRELYVFMKDVSVYTFDQVAKTKTGGQALILSGQLRDLLKSDRAKKLYYDIKRLRAGYKAGNLALDDFASQSPVTILRELSGFVSMVPGVIAGPMTGGAVAAPEWDVFSDTMGLISAFSWDVYSGE